MSGAKIKIAETKKNTITSESASVQVLQGNILVVPAQNVVPESVYVISRITYYLKIWDVNFKHINLK